jgi:hypothetical protein
MRALALLAVLAAGLLAGANVAARPTVEWTCVENTDEVLLNNTNGFGVKSGGTPPSFSTDGKAYCVTYLEHYHWNDGKGGAPGRIGLKGPTTVSFQALGSSGQGGAKNVNHYVYVPTTPTPVVIKGTYTCTDTAAATWSSNEKSGGRGFCIVKGMLAIQKIVIPGGSTTTTTTTTEETPGYDLVATAQPASSIGVRSKDGATIAFATELVVRNDTHAGSTSDATTLRLRVDAARAALKVRLQVKGPGGVCAPASCEVPPLKPGQEATYRVAIVRAAGAPAGVVAIRMDVACSDEESLCSNNVFPRQPAGDPVTLVVEPKRATVVVTKAEDPASADLEATVKFYGDPVDGIEGRYLFDWTITVTNNGPQAARDIDVILMGPKPDGNIPHGLGVGGTRSWLGPPECREEGARTWRCHYAVLPAGKFFVYLITGFPDTPGFYEVRVSAHAATHDPNPTNNKVTRETTIH